MLDRNEHVKGCSRSDLSDSDCMKNSQAGVAVRRERRSGGSGGQAGAAGTKKNKKIKKIKKNTGCLFY